MAYKQKRVAVLIAAAGMGKRMNAKINKQYIKIKEKAVIERTIDAFEKSNLIDEMIIVVREDEIKFFEEEILSKNNYKTNIKLARGGRERFDSVKNGLNKVSKDMDVVLIHDGARPFIDKKLIENSIQGVIDYNACILGVKVKDTIKSVTEDGFVDKTLKRSTLWSIQTPQSFYLKDIIKAYEEVELTKDITDDSSVFEKWGRSVKIVEGSYNNIKITTQEDLIFAENILKQMEE